MVTVVVTSCGRISLLKRTIESFNMFNTYPITEFIIVDDSGNQEVHEELRALFTDCMLILYPKNRGLIQCIDDAYSWIKTPYIFHMEDDWEFIHSGFIEKSIVILDNVAEIMQVWIRGYNNPNGHPIDTEVFNVNGVEYRLVCAVPHHDPAWHGFTFNPGLRRLSDYLLLAPFVNVGDHPGIGQRECNIGEAFYQLGFRAAAIGEECCVHIGGQSRTYVV